MRDKNPLPKFGSPKNPFLRRQEAAKSAVPGATAAAQPGVVQMTPAEVAAARLKETMRLPAIAAKGPANTVPRTESAPGLLQRLARFAGKLNPFVRRSGRSLFRRAASSASSRSSVQGELSLDKIKVVRNDLNEADVEIVPAGSAAKRKSAQPAGARAAARLAGM
jgi:hypothetical protein